MATTVVQAGGPGAVTLGVKSDVITPYKYQWRRNGKMLGGSQWSSYTISDMKPEDYTAKWTVTVYGENGTEESAAYTLTKPVPLPVAPIPHPAIVYGVPTSTNLAGKGFTPEQLAGVKGK